METTPTLTAHGSKITGGYFERSNKDQETVNQVSHLRTHLKICRINVQSSVFIRLEFHQDNICIINIQLSIIHCKLFQKKLYLYHLIHYNFFVFQIPIVQRPRTKPSQGLNTGSTPVGNATKVNIRQTQSSIPKHRYEQSLPGIVFSLFFNRDCYFVIFHAPSSQ